MTSRCAAKGCDREATVEAAGLLCAAHHLLLKRGKRVTLDKEASQVVRAAVGEMRKAAAEEQQNAAQRLDERQFGSEGNTGAQDGKHHNPSRTTDKQSSPDQRRWRIALATAGFTGLVLIVEAIERVRLDVPGGIGGLSWQSVDIAIDNALPVLVFLLIVWVAIAVFLFLFGGVVGAVLKGSLYALRSPGALLWSAMMTTKAAIWSMIHLNWFHGMIPYRRGIELAKRDHTPTPRFEMLLARYRCWIKQMVASVEDWRSRWKVGPYLMPEAVREKLVGFLDKGWYAGRISILLIVPSALGVGFISMERVDELKQRLAANDFCESSEQSWYDWLASPLRIHVVCGQLVFDDKYPNLASGLGYDPEFVRLASIAKQVPTGFRSEQIAYIKDFGSWALVARPEIMRVDEASETFLIQCLALLPIDWDWVDVQLRRVSVSIPKGSWVDRVKNQSQRSRGLEDRANPEPPIFAIDRAHIVEFVKTTDTRVEKVPADPKKDSNAQEPMFVAEPLSKHDRGKLQVILAARQPDEWTKKLDELTRTVSKQSADFEAHEREVKVAFHTFRAADGALAKLAAGNLTNVQRLSQDIWRLGREWQSTPVVCPIVRRDCLDLYWLLPRGQGALTAQLTAVNSELSEMRAHLAAIANRPPIELSADASSLFEAVKAAKERLSELPEIVTVGIGAGSFPQSPGQYSFDLDINLAEGWTFQEFMVSGAGGEPQTLLQTVFEQCQPHVAATFPMGVWGLASAAWRLPIVESNKLDWALNWSDVVDDVPSAEEIGPILNAEGKVIANGKIFVIGSADQAGTPSINLNLSRKRAREVQAWLTKEIGWPSEAVTALSIGDMGFLESRALPADENDELQRSAQVFWCPNGDELLASAHDSPGE